MAPAADGGANQIIADLYTSHALDLLRVEAGERRRIRELLTDLEAELVAQLAKVDPTGVQRESYRVQRLEKLLAQVKDTIAASYRAASQELGGELAELAEIEAEFAVRTLNGATELELFSGLLTRSQARALIGEVLVMGAPVSEWWSRQAGDTLQRFTDAMRLGIAQGETSADLIRRIRGGTKNGEPVVGFMDISRRNADSLVRAATQAIAERAKEYVYEANADLLAAVVWTSTLDSRTTVQCMVRDGLRYTPVEHKPIGHAVPWLSGPGNLHWGCRSTSRPETKSWREMGIDVDDLPPATRASVNGQVAADTTLEGWLQRQPRDVQDAALGVGRADLWRDGKISFRDLIDANGRELSLAELRARMGAATFKPSIMTDADLAHYERVLERGRKSNTEHLSAYDIETGRQWTSSGSANFVSLPEVMAAEVTRGKPRFVIHHNHPSSRSFSPQDFSAVGTYQGIKTLYAHGHDGSIYRADRTGSFSAEILRQANNAVAAPFIEYEKEFASNADRMTLFAHMQALWLNERGYISYTYELGSEISAAYERNKAIIDSIAETFR